MARQTDPRAARLLPLPSVQEAKVNGDEVIIVATRYELGSGVGLRLEGTRRESTLGGAQHSVGVRGRLRFR